MYWEQVSRGHWRVCCASLQLEGIQDSRLTWAWESRRCLWPQDRGPALPGVFGGWRIFHGVFATQQRGNQAGGIARVSQEDQVESEETSMTGVLVTTGSRGWVGGGGGRSQRRWERRRRRSLTVWSIDYYLGWILTFFFYKDVRAYKKIHYLDLMTIKICIFATLFFLRCFGVDCRLLGFHPLLWILEAASAENWGTFLQSQQCCHT